MLSQHRQNMDSWVFSAFCPLQDSFIDRMISMGLENCLSSFCKSRDSINSRMAKYLYAYMLHIQAYIHIHISMCIYTWYVPCYTYAYMYLHTYIHICIYVRSDLVNPVPSAREK